MEEDAAGAGGGGRGSPLPVLEKARPPEPGEEMQEDDDEDEDEENEEDEEDEKEDEEVCPGCKVMSAELDRLNGSEMTRRTWYKKVQPNTGGTHSRVRELVRAHRNCTRPLFHSNATKRWGRQACCLVRLVHLYQGAAGAVRRRRRRRGEEGHLQRRGACAEWLRLLYGSILCIPFPRTREPLSQLSPRSS